MSTTRAKSSAASNNDDRSTKSGRSSKSNRSSKSDRSSKSKRRFPKSLSLMTLRPKLPRLDSDSTVDSHGGLSTDSSVLTSSDFTLGTTDDEIESFLEVEKLGDIAKEKKDYQQAKHSFEVALNLLRKILKPNDPIIERLKEKLEEVVEIIGESPSTQDPSLLNDTQDRTSAPRDGIKKFFSDRQLFDNSDMSEPQDKDSLEYVGQVFQNHKSAGEKSLQYQNGGDALYNYNQMLLLVRKYDGAATEEELAIKGITLNEAQILDIIGEVQVLLKNYDASLIAFTESIAIRKRTKADKIALSSTHHKMGRIYEFLGDKVNARKHYKKSIKWKKRNHRDMIKSVFNVNSAIDPSVDKSVNEKISGKQCTVYNRIGIQLAKKASFDEALEFFHTSVLNLSSSEGDDPDIDAMTYNNLGNTYSFSGKNDETPLKYYLLALQSVKSKDPYVRAGTFYNCGVYYQKKGMLDHAKTCFEEALQCYEDIDLKDIDDKDTNSMLSNLFNNVGNVLFDEERYKESSHYYKDALKMKEIAYGEVSEELFGTLCNLGIVMLKLDKVDSAFSYLENGLNILKEKEISDVRRGDVLKKLGNVSMLKKDYNTAYDYYTESLTVYRKVYQDNSHEEILSTLVLIAQVLYRQEKWDHSARTYETVYKRMISKLENDNVETGKVILDTAYTYYKKGDVEKAIEMNTKATKIFESLSIPDDHYNVRHAQKLSKKLLKFQNSSEEEEESEE